MRNIRRLFFYIIIITFFVSCKKKDKTYENITFYSGAYAGTILEYINSQPAGIFDSLKIVVNRIEGFSELLKNDSITFFAPVNKNFELFIGNLNLERTSSSLNKAPLSLSGINIQDLDTSLTRYLIAGSILTDSLKNFSSGNIYKAAKYSIPMHLQFYASNASGLLAKGTSAIILSATYDSENNKDWERTQTDIVNIKAKNGIIHIIGSGEVYGLGGNLIKSINDRQ